MQTLLRAFTLALPIAVPIGAVGSAPSIPDSGKVALARFLAASVDRGDVPAVAAIVVNRDSTLYGGAFGKRDAAGNKPATPQTIFRIASMTKPVTSLAIMMLHHLSGGGWGVVLRRIFEAATRVLPLMAVLFLPVLAPAGRRSVPSRCAIC